MANETIFGIPINRVVAFVGPYVAIASGALADFLLVHIHVLALFHTTHTQLASAISQVVVFGLTSLVVWAGHQKWLTGWQQHEMFHAPLPEGDPADTKGLRDVPGGAEIETPPAPTASSPEGDPSA